MKSVLEYLSEWAKNIKKVKAKQFFLHGAFEYYLETYFQYFKENEDVESQGTHIKKYFGISVSHESNLRSIGKLADKYP